MPNTQKPAPVAAKQVAIVNDEERQKKLNELRDKGGATESLKQTFPSLRLEHTTDMEGEPNQYKGQFTLLSKDKKGENIVEALGKNIKMDILKQRYMLSMTKNNGKDKYSTREFDKDIKDGGKVILFKRVDNADKADQLGEKTVAEWLADFPNTDANSKRHSDLWVLYIIYARLPDGRIVKWKTNVSAMVSYGNYQRNVNVFGVTTEVTSEEKKNGANKYYVPEFHAVAEIEDLDTQINDQALLNQILAEPSSNNVQAALAAFEGSEVVDPTLDAPVTEDLPFKD